MPFIEQFLVECTCFFGLRTEQPKARNIKVNRATDGFSTVSRKLVAHFSYPRDDFLQNIPISSMYIDAVLKSRRRTLERDCKVKKLYKKTENVLVIIPKLFFKMNIFARL